MIGRIVVPERSGALAAGLLGGVAAFQVALAAGAPWGAAAWGGRYRGKLPAGLRLASAGSAVALSAIALLAVADGRATTRIRVLRGASVYLAVGTVANGASPSRIERTWSPVNAAAAMLLWRTASASTSHGR